MTSKRFNSKIVGIILALLVALGTGVAFAQNDGTPTPAVTADDDSSLDGTDSDSMSSDGDSSLDGDSMSADDDSSSSAPATP